MTERYQTNDFNPHRAPAVVPRQGPDLRGLSQFGRSLDNYLDAKSYKEGREQGYQEQIGRDQYLGDVEPSLLDPARAAGRTKARQVAYGARQEMRLKRSLLDLEQKYRLDPQGFREASADLQKGFFENAPVEILPQMQEMFDRRVFRVEAGITERRAVQDRRDQANDILMNMDDLTQSVVQDTLLNGPSDPHTDQIRRWQGYARQLQRLGMMTPKQRESAQREMEFKITQSNAIYRIRRGERAERIAKDIQDPRNPTYSVLRVDQQQRLLRDIRREESLREQGLATDRSVLGDRFEAQLREGFLKGKVPETPEAAMQLRRDYEDQMIRLKVAQPTIEKNLRAFDQALALGNDVKTLNLGSLLENVQQVKQAQNDAVSFRGDPLEQSRLNTRADLLQRALAEKAKMFQDDPVRALQVYNPDLAATLKFENDADIVASQKVLAQVTGNPNVVAVPGELLAGIAGQMAQAQTAEQKGLVLGALVQQYPDQADEILTAAGLTRTDLMAGQMFAAGETTASQQLLLAAETRKENKNFARTEDVDNAFASAFGEKSARTLFDDYREPFADLYRYYLRNSGEKAAGELAYKTLMRNRQLVEVGGNPIILDAQADPVTFRYALDNFKKNLIGNGVVLGTDPTLRMTPTELRDLLDDPRKWHWEKAGRGWAISANDGRGVYVQTKSGQALAIFDPVTGTHNIVPSDPNTRRNDLSLEDRNWGRPVRTEPQERPLPTEVIALGAGATGFEIEPVETTAERAFNLGVENGLVADRFLGVVRKNPARLSALAGASFATLGGDLPEWAVEVLSTSGVPEFKALDNPEVLEIVKKLWSDPDERLKPINGRIPEPSESLAIITERARQDWIRATRIEPRFTRSPIPSKKNSSGTLNLEGIDKISFDESRVTPAFDALETALFQRESGGDYARLERRYQGHAGAYQLSPAALIDAGLMKPEAKDSRLSKKAQLEDKSLWTIPGGLKTFLARPDLQDKAFREFTRKNLQVLVRNGTIDQTTPIDEVMGWLAVAHLLGASSAKRAKAGELVNPDGNGTTWETYYRLGQDAAIRAGKAIDL